MLDLNFTTDKVETEISNSALRSDPKRNVNVESAKSTVEWEMELECRSWGVKDLYPHVRKVCSEWTEVEWTEGDDIETFKEVTFDPDEFEISASKGDSASCYPVNVMIDFDKKKIEVEFS